MATDVADLHHSTEYGRVRAINLNVAVVAQHQRDGVPGDAAVKQFTLGGG
jgi:hypothetical protein